jgi:hypothetical protein
MKHYKPILFVCAAILLALSLGFWHGDDFHSTADRVLLLLPDGTNESDPRVTVWLDAAREEGMHVVPIHDSEFLRPLQGESKCAGIILPDSIHQEASDLFVAGVERFVASGGKLMLVYDAGTLSLSGRYAAGHSRFSGLAGIDYALYSKLADHTTEWSALTTTDSLIRQLEIPPGVYFPFEPPADSSRGKAAAPHGANDDFEVQLTRYKYGELKYPSFVTEGQYSGKVLFHSAGGLVAGERPYQKGSVLFVNLPLGYLKANTDGLLLHAMLRYFADYSLSVPRLLPVPDGVGGVVLNWHVDSNAAIKPLQELSSWTLPQQGPYSIHVTAGPDTVTIGDKMGFDVEHNPASQELIRHYSALGNEIGSHGGWIHNYFAAHVDTDAPEQMEPFLAMNKSALEKVVDKPVIEYSAPNGDQPQWVTHWLDVHGFVGYYFTGDAGMAPTQGYRDGKRSGENIWAFPIVHLDLAASFEEMTRLQYPDSEIEHWLNAVAEFTADQRTARLIYFHPRGILPYHEVFDHWMENTARLKEEGKFRWYTMTELAHFLNSRKQVKWKLASRAGLVTVEAMHPESLAHETWRLPADKYAQPTIIRGNAQVAKAGNAWMVIAGAGKDLQFQTAMLPQ